jgi:hypothetical protein
MNHVVLILYLAKSARSRFVPTVAAQIPEKTSQPKCVAVDSGRRSASSMPRTSTNVIWRIFSAIRAKPTRDSIDVNTVANENSLFAHDARR